MREKISVDKVPPLKFAQHFCNEVLIKRDKNPEACWLLVEGPTDMQALQDHCKNSPCICKDCNGRNSVIAAVGLAEDPKQHNGKPLGGIIGLVDNDYCHLIPEKKLPSRVVMFEGVNDLESAVLFHRGPLILSMLVRIKEWIASVDSDLDTDPWGFTNQKNPLGALVKNIVGPIGALRVAFQMMPSEYRLGKKSFSGKLDIERSSIVERAWKHQNPSLQLTSEILSCLPSDELVPERDDRHKLKNSIESHMENVNKNPWSYGRGKDLVSTLAHALAFNQKVLIYNERNSSVRELDKEIQRLIPAVFDEEVLEYCRFKELVKEATRAEGGIYQYF